MNRSRIVVFGAGVLMLGIAAVPPVWGQRGQGPCKADVEKFCKDVRPGGGRIRDCLKQHQAELSEACKQRLQSRPARAAERLRACDADIQKLCKDVAPGGGRLVSCLREHESELSADCKASLARGKGRRGLGPRK